MTRIVMPNHVHLIAVPLTPESLCLAIGEAHRRYSRRINFREDWQGHLWQDRFSSFVMDQRYLLACTRYIENNPVRAKLVKHPEQWVWSSAAAHIAGSNDRLVKVEPLLSIISSDWRQFLTGALLTDEENNIRGHTCTGRPLGSRVFVKQLENTLGRRLRPQKPGRKPKPAKN